ncbi:cysteine-rich receptor-like protein kinase 10 isoform X2 [Magnolia sinica]|uniref:cysteine-rich receptor-like protein kinase 10 isoform X2 n=1 Tax=Magnolia sinica TaxID=86752 RepID=UPI0026582C26|nr:cysteine-rich receptor-like protein kinase 10 isoform X2 [Magnolia sinica]
MFFLFPHTLIFFSLSSLSALLYTPVSAQLPEFSCSTTSNYTTNSAFETNLNLLLSSLSSNASRSGFFNDTSGDDPDRVYGLVLCRGDATPDRCQSCATIASQGVIQACPSSKNGTIWYIYCMLRYSNVRFFSALDNSTVRYEGNAQNVSDPDHFNQVLIGVMSNISEAAASGNSTRMFATGDGNLTSVQRVYGLVQCTEDLSRSDCNLCLRSAIADIPTCCDGKQGGKVLRLSCNLRFEIYPFFDELDNAGPAPPLPSTTATAAAPASATAADGPDIGEMDSLQFDLVTIRAATNNFSDANKLGQGGFGAVYKGRLDDQEIAVKRLFRNTKDGLEEFKNEVVLVAKLQHRNLVRLLGCCLDGDEQILIFEYVPNKSLEKFLHDPTKRACLDWERRYKIIGGIARGLLYLHEDSRLKIIHRDLKASNILLDGEMNAKISDFGTAKLFEVGQTQGNTSRITGTYGYMSPEYAMHGKFSIKSDVFSFGVLLLEIVSGLKSYAFYQSDLAQDLPSYAWRHWTEGTVSELIDPTLRECCPRNEALKCIHIGLLCVQEHVTDRPTMSSVVQMLSNEPINLPSPLPPVFSMVSRANTNTASGDCDSPTSNKSESRLFIPWTVNEISSTEFDPR